MKLTRNEYCCYDTAITWDCHKTLVKHETGFTKNLIACLNKLMISNVDDILFDKEKVKARKALIEKSKPIKTTKQMLIDLGYMKPRESYSPWKLQKAINMSKKNEDTFLLNKHLNYAQLLKEKNLIDKIVEMKFSSSIIHDVIDFEFVLCNSGLQSVDWRCSSDIIVNLMDVGNVTKIEANNLLHYFNVEEQDRKMFEMIWKEDISRNFSLELNMTKDECEAIVRMKYSHVDELKFEIISKMGEWLDFEWTDHKMKFTLPNEKAIFSMIYDQSVCESIVGHVLERSNERIVVAGNSVIEI